MNALAGSLLHNAQAILNRSRPAGQFASSATFLPSLLPAIVHVIPVAQHRLLYNRIANFFVIFHEVFIPYTLPSKSPWLLMLKNKPCSAASI